MDHDCKNPCDLCKKKDCDYDFDCAFGGIAKNYTCAELQCFLNYEGSCMVELYERCGAWEE